MSPRQNANAPKAAAGRARSSPIADHKTEPSGGPSQSGADFRRDRRRLALLALALSALTLAVHWPVLSAQALSFDDAQFVTENYLVQHPSWHSAGRFFGEILNPSTVHGYSLPLSMTSLMLDWALGGRADYLFPFHRTSLALHVANVILVLLLVYSCFGNPWSAAAVALIFGLHPLTVEPIAWVGERKTLLAAFFSLIALLCYVRYARSGSRILLGGAVALYVLALLSKPTAWPLWLCLFVLDYWPLDRLNRRTIIEKWPLVIVATLSAAVTLISHENTAGVSSTKSLGQLLLQPAYLLPFYFGKIVWPTNLTPVYVMPSPMSATNPLVLAGAAACLGLAVVVVASLQRTRGLLAGVLFFVLMLAPTLGLIQYSWVVASDKYVYLAGVGLLLPAAFLLGRWMPRERIAESRPAGAVLTVVAVIALVEAVGCRTYLRQWRTSETFARHVVRLAPLSPYTHSLLGNALLEAGKGEEALATYRKVLEIDPGHPRWHYVYAFSLARLGRTDEAIVHYRLAIEADPQNVEAHNNLANLLARRGAYDEARPHYTRVLELRPDSPEAHYNLANTYLALKQPQAAIPHLQAALQKVPGRAQLHFKMGVALEETGQFRAAAAAYQQALQLNPRYRDARQKLERLLSSQPASPDSQ